MTGARRRNVEAALLVLSAAIAVGGWWLTSLGQSNTGKVPANGVVKYAVVFVGLYLVAHLAVRRLAPEADPLFLPLAALLNAIGFVLIASLEKPIGNPGLADAQVRWLGVSVVAFVAVLILIPDVRGLARYRYSMAALGLVLLLLPVVPGLGREINGAQLWIRIGKLNFQPAELGKIALVVFFAAYLAERRELLSVATRRVGPIGFPEARHFGPVVAAWAISMLVMVREKDLGSSLLFFGIFVVMLWMATARPAYFLVATALFVLGAVFAYHEFAHVRARFLVWQDPFKTANTSGFQVVQSLFALATGGVWGTGLGLGRPELIGRSSVHTDFIFSALGEELGLAGTTAVLTASALFTMRGFGLATRCRDDFSKLLAAGLSTAMALQTLLIVGGVTNLIPLTGVTLPFMSYGGSSLLSSFILVALLLRISDEVARQTGEGPPTEISAPAGGAR
jgi:cell division protein FtsW (lipid II flippase)